MTTFNSGEDWAKFQLDKLKKLEARNEPLKLAAIETHRRMVNRIFESQKDADYTEIANPSTKPIYINPKNSPKKFTPKGKGRKKKNAEPNKTRYFSGGYAEFKRLIGRPKLVLFGQLRNDFRAGIKKLDSFTWVSYFKNDINAKKADRLEKKYNRSPIFKLTKQERESFISLYTKLVTKYLNG